MEVSSYQITTVYSNTTAVVDVYWNTKSLFTCGWVIKFGSSTCVFSPPTDPPGVLARGKDTKINLDDEWKCRKTRTFFTVVENSTLSRAQCAGPTPVMRSLADGCSGTGNNAAWGTWSVKSVDTLTACTNWLIVLERKHARLSLSKKTFMRPPRFSLLAAISQHQ